MLPRCTSRTIPVVSAVFSVALFHSAPVLAENRTFDGTGNNLTHADWGAAGAMVLRLSPNAYTDGFSAPAGLTRSNPRAISNAVVRQTGSIVNHRGLSDWVWQWGQFLDHDLDLMNPTEPAEPMPITVPLGDPVFSFPSIPFNRTEYASGTGTAPGNPRRQVNSISSFLDASMVYGSDAATAASLRAPTGGRMLVTPHTGGDLLPTDGGGNFLAGDVRVNEQLGLTAVHTLMVREHNYWAEQVAIANPAFTDEQVYQRARKIVGAEVQAVTFNEWLPSLIGTANVPSYQGYSPAIDPTVSNEFASALFRVGHTMLSPVLQRLDDTGNPIAQGNVSLQNAFFAPSRIVNEGGVDPLLKGLASQAMQEVDQHIVEDVRSFLFTIPTGGLDLAALNIQRGRDHGLADYNALRVTYGLPAVTGFGEISSNAALVAALQSVYSDVNEIDAWVGALSEDHLPDSSFGPLLTSAIMDQFLRSRAGDRFWYQNDPELAGLLASIDGTTLGQIIERNSGITSLQANVFVVPEPGALAGLVAVSTMCMRRKRR